MSKSRVGGYAEQKYLGWGKGSAKMKWKPSAFVKGKGRDPVRLIANRRSPLPGTFPRHERMFRGFEHLDKLTPKKFGKYPVAERYNMVKNFGLVREWRKKYEPVVPIGKKPGPKMAKKKAAITRGDYEALAGRKARSKKEMAAPVRSPVSAGLATVPVSAAAAAVLAANAAVCAAHPLMQLDAAGTPYVAPANKKAWQYVDHLFDDMYGTP